MDVNKIYHGKMEIVLKDFPEWFCDSIVTDPPYGLKFMGKKWDYGVPTVEQWLEAFRVLKPGGHLLCACGTRTQHRMAVNIEDAGFEIRDVITWHYGSGFPKSLDISKQLDKQAGVERTVIGKNKAGNTSKAFNLREQYDGTDLFLTGGEYDVTEPATDEAKQWDGYGTALKPATEFWTLARKPLSESTVAENVLKYGTGGINIDGCRIGLEGGTTRSGESVFTKEAIEGEIHATRGYSTGHDIEELNKGRFPANVILDEFMAAELDKQSIENGIHSAGAGRIKMVQSDYSASSYDMSGKRQMNRYEDDENIGASRFFYTAKADGFERNKGLNKLQQKRIEGRDEGQDERNVPYKNRISPRANIHPTVKPIDLMRYLVRLITPKGGIVLDPFNGSGTTGIAAKLELMKYVGIEMDEEYCKISEARIAAWNPERYIPQTLF